MEKQPFSGLSYYQYKAGIAYEVTFPKKLWDDSKTMSWEYLFDTIDFESRDERRYCVLLRRPLHAVKSPVERAIIVMRALYTILGTPQNELVVEDAEHPNKLLDYMQIDPSEVRQLLLSYITKRHDLLFDQPYGGMELFAAIHVSPRLLKRQLEWLDHERVLTFNLSSLQQSRKRTVEAMLRYRMVLNSDSLSEVIKQVEKAIPVTTDGPLRAFISYSHEDRKVAGKIKNYLEKHGVTAFLAHDNIKVSKEWESEIRKELHECDIFVPLLTDNFRPSKWTDQEAGFAVGLDKTVFPLMVEDIPHGFLERIQAIKLDVSNVEPACEKIIAVIHDDEKLGPLLSKSQPKQVT